MEILCIRLRIPDNANLILGQSHFIKTAEDLYEVVVNTVPAPNSLSPSTKPPALA